MLLLLQRGLQMEAEGCGDAEHCSVAGTRGRIPLIEPHVVQGVGGARELSISLAASFREASEGGRTRLISPPQQHGEQDTLVYFSGFFFLNRTDVAVSPLIFQSYTYLLLFVRLQEKKKKVNPSLGFFKSRWQRKIRKWNYCMVFKKKKIEVCAL